MKGNADNTMARIFDFFDFSDKKDKGRDPEKDNRREVPLPGLPSGIRGQLLEVLGEADYRRFEPVVLNVYRMTRIYPAAVEYHHAEKGGLFRHSVEVALDMYLRFRDEERRILETDKKTGNISYNDTRYLREQYLKCAFLAGLLHDIGKVMDYKVVSGNIELKLNALDVRGFMKAIDALPRSGTREYEKLGVEKLHYRKYSIHGDLSAALMLLVIPDTLLKELDTEVLAYMHDAISLSHFEGYRSEGNILLQLLRAADGDSTRKDVNRAGLSESPESPFAVAEGFAPEIVTLAPLTGNGVLTPFVENGVVEPVVTDVSIPGAVTPDQTLMGEPVTATSVETPDSGIHPPQSVKGVHTPSGVNTPVNPYIAIMKQRILSGELTINSPGFFQVYIDKAGDRVVINANNAIDEMFRSLKESSKFAVVQFIRKSGLIAEKNRGKEILKIRYEDGRGRQIPAVILKLKPFGFTDEFLEQCGEVPFYEVVKDGVHTSSGVNAGSGTSTTSGVSSITSDDVKELVPDEPVVMEESSEDDVPPMDEYESGRIDDDFLAVEHHDG
ncbi:MAG: TraI domain-containing protein [Thermodesulfovibrionales bacterium]